jgi:hypothetical protein
MKSIQQFPAGNGEGGPPILSVGSQDLRAYMLNIHRNLAYDVMADVWSMCSAYGHCENRATKEEFCRFWKVCSDWGNSKKLRFPVRKLQRLLLIVGREETFWGLQQHVNAKPKPRRK